MAYKIPPLRFAYDALEPYIDAETMELHHDRHHQTYVDNVNKAIEPYPHLADLTIIAWDVVDERLHNFMRETSQLQQSPRRIAHANQ